MFLQETQTTKTIGSDAWLVKDVIWHSISNILESLTERLPYLVAGFIVLVLFWFLARIIKNTFWKASAKTKLDPRLRTLFSRLISVVVLFVGVFAAMTVIFPTFKFSDLIAGLGFTSFVVGFATKDILNNLLSGVLILWQQPFKIGDYVFIGSNQGKVEQIGIRATQLLKDDGELVLIPNGEMYSSAMTIRGAGSERRMLLSVNISYKADIEETKSQILEVLKNTAGVLVNPSSSVVVTNLADNGVNLSIYFWINTDEYRPMDVFDRVATSVKKILEDITVEIATNAESNAKQLDGTSQTQPTEPKKKDDLS